MASYTTEQLRNVVLIGHSSSGKTTLAEALLFDTGASSRRGRVEDGSTVSDWDDEAIRRRISVGTSVVPCEWQGNKVNILDTPGFIDFVGETKGAVAVADSALVLVDSVAGVEVGTELGWGYLDERSLPRAIFVNKMDRETRISRRRSATCATLSAARSCRCTYRSARGASSAAWSI